MDHDPDNGDLAIGDGGANVLFIEGDAADQSTLYDPTTIKWRMADTTTSNTQLYGVKFSPKTVALFGNKVLLVTCGNLGWSPYIYFVNPRHGTSPFFEVISPVKYITPAFSA